MSTISLRTCVKGYVKDGQRANDYAFTVKFWNKLLREGKMKAKNRKCNDQTLWDALCRNYTYWYSIVDSEEDLEKKERLNTQLNLIEKFFTDEWKTDVLEYYKRQDPEQYYKTKLKIKARREVPETYYIRNGISMPEDRVIKCNTFFLIDPKEWDKYKQEVIRKRKGDKTNEKNQ